MSKYLKKAACSLAAAAMLCGAVCGISAVADEEKVPVVDALFAASVTEELSSEEASSEEPSSEDSTKREAPTRQNIEPAGDTDDGTVRPTLPVIDNITPAGEPAGDGDFTPTPPTNPSTTSRYGYNSYNRSTTTKSYLSSSTTGTVSATGDKTGITAAMATLLIASGTAFALTGDRRRKDS